MNDDKLTQRATRVLHHIEATLVALLVTVGINLGLIVAIIIVGGGR